MQKPVWLFIALTLAFFTFRVASAEDVYNFYFQKGSGPETVIQGAPGDSGQKVVKKKKKPAVAAAETDEVEDDDEQYDDKDLPASRSQYVAESADPQRGEKGRKWTLRAGVGAVGYTGSGLNPDYVYSQDGYYNSYDPYQSNSGIGTFVVGANYHWNRYLDMDIELQFMDDEQTKTSNFRGPVEASWGLGVTPLHLNLFGRETIRLGAVAGVIGGTRFVDSDGNAMPAEFHTGLFIGPRIEVAITDKLGVQLAARFDQSYKNFYHSSLALTYDF